jgi:hypothetical protein
MLLQGSPRGGFVVADWHDGTLREFSREGEELWRFGRSGEGPGEFLSVIEAEFDTSGNLLVLDRGTGRITTVSPVGELVSSVRFPAEGTQILPEAFDPGGWATLPNLGRSEVLWASFAKTAPHRSRRSVTVPSAISFREDIVGERWAANAPDGGAVVFFRWSSQMVFLAADGTVQSVASGVEPISFPQGVAVERSGQGWSVSGFRVDPQAVEATRSAAVGDDGVFVLFLGATNEAGRIVDRYSRLGIYEGSYLLPENVRGKKIAALTDGRFAVLDTDFIPTVWVFSGR